MPTQKTITACCDNAYDPLQGSPGPGQCVPIVCPLGPVEPWEPTCATIFPESFLCPEDPIPPPVPCSAGTFRQYRTEPYEGSGFKCVYYRLCPCGLGPTECDEVSGFELCSITTNHVAYVGCPADQTSAYCGSYVTCNREALPPEDWAESQYDVCFATSCEALGSDPGSCISTSGCDSIVKVPRTLEFFTCGTVRASAEGCEWQCLITPPCNPFALCGSYNACPEPDCCPGPDC